ncbi:alpha/beta hydrolase [Roseiterribacter gracilis]|uniref:Acetylhydrolase n=1 Tax=Roseiterribacter gracilis TaxID=2812848 RepID=A0A8S8XB63_9PROT|nr:acetylhydrolase [Rhodospirillales bacterium TMPK1]
MYDLDAESTDLLLRMGRDFATMPAKPTIEERRAALRFMAEAYGPAPAPVASMEDRVIDGPGGALPLRIYHPVQPAGDTPPVVLHMHGGGWALGDRDSYERICRAYCAEAGAILVDVDYRRAPEHQYPAALLDCEAALRWTASNAAALGGHRDRLVVTGDSAGGNLAAAVCQRSTVPVALQLLIYPVMTASDDAEFTSRHELGDGRYFLSLRDIRHAEHEYLGGTGRAHEPGASPILEPDVAHVPPALIITAALDPLRDEGAAYAERLRRAGVDVRYECVPGTIHGFVLFAGALSSGRDAIVRIGTAIRNLRPYD